MSKFVFTPELTKEDARRIIDALRFQTKHQDCDSKVSKCAQVLRNKELITRLRKLAKIKGKTNEAGI